MARVTPNYAANDLIPSPGPNAGELYLYLEQLRDGQPVQAFGIGAERSAAT